MGLNPTGGSGEHNWNYSQPNKPGFSTDLIGTVAAIQEVQAMNFGPDGPTTPKFWKDGNPVWNIRMVIVGPNGGYRTWTFQPASKAAREGKKKSVHLDLFALTGNTDMMNLIGKTIHIRTKQPPEGFSYGIGNPRPWEVELVEEGPYALSSPLDPIFTVPQVLANSAASGGQVNNGQQSANNMQSAPQVAPAMAPDAAPAPAVNGTYDDGGVYDEDIPF